MGGTVRRALCQQGMGPFTHSHPHGVCLATCANGRGHGLDERRRSLCGGTLNLARQPRHNVLLT